MADARPANPPVGTPYDTPTGTAGTADTGGPGDTGDAGDVVETPSAPSPEAVNTLIGELFPGTGHSCVDLGNDFALARSVVDPEALRPGGFVSGPTQFGLADAVLWYMVFGALGRIEPMAMTSELSIRYLRPARGEVLWAHASLESAGRRNVVGTVHLWCDDQTDRITATAQGTYALPI